MAYDRLSPEALAAALDDEQQSGVQPLSPDDLMAGIDGEGATGTKRGEQLASHTAAAQGQLLNEQSIATAEYAIDPQSELDVAAQEHFNLIEGELAGMVNQSFQDDQMDVTQATETLKQGLEVIDGQRSSPTSREQAIIQGASTTPLREDVRKELAANLAMSSELGRIMDEVGMFDQVLEIAGMFVPGRQALEWEDFLDGVEGSRELSKYISGNNIGGMITSWQLLDSERKLELFPSLVETALKASGIQGVGDIATTDKNTMVALGMLIHFLSPEGAERATTERNVILGIDIASIIPVSQLGRLGKLGKIAPEAQRAAGTTASGTRGSPRRPTPDKPFPKTDPSQGVTVEGEVVGKTLSDVNALPEPMRKRMELLMAKTAEYAHKENNMVALLARAGQMEQAARANLGAMDSATLSRTFDIPTDRAMQNAMPFQTKVWLGEAVDGLIPEVSAQLNDFYRIAEGHVRSMTTESGLLQIGALSKPDRTLAKKNFYDEIKAHRSDYAQEGLSLSEVKIVKEDAHAFEFEYTLTNKQGFEQEFKGRRSWRINQVTQNFEETTADLAKGGNIPGLSPAAWSKTGGKGTVDFGDSVKDALLLGDVATASKKAYNDIWLSASEDIGGVGDTPARQRVSAIESAGNHWQNPETFETGRTFSPMELKAGIPTSIGTVRLTDPKEVAAYYKRRLVADAFHATRNYVTRREMELEGMKAMVVTPVAGEQMIYGRPFEMGSAISSIANKKGYKSWNAKTGLSDDLTPTYIAEQYAEGNVLVRLRKDWNTIGSEFAKGGEFVEYVTISKDKIKQLPDQVMNYRQGYVPDIVEGVEYIVTRNWPITKAGTSGRFYKEPLRRFASRMDADTFIKERAALEAQKNGGKVEDYVHLFERGDDSIMTQMDKADSFIGGSAGMFTGSRAKDEILVGLSGRKPDYMSPHDAYGRYVDHLGDKVSKNEWIFGQQKQWLNTVKQNFPELRGAFDTIALPNNAVGDGLSMERAEIQRWSRVPTTQETLWEGLAQNIHDYALTGGRYLGLSKEAVPLLQSLKHADITSAVKAANMHLTLGTMNPAQIYVQASAATVALSMSEVAKIPSVLWSSAQMATMDLVLNKDVRASMAARLDTRSPMEIGSYFEMYQLWERSGLRESVRTNADINYMSTTGLGITSDVLRKMDNWSLMFYRNAELVNRRISYSVAYNNWRKANPTAPVNDDVAATIGKDANRFMLELGEANAAYWQGGNGAKAHQKILSVATQFMQVMAKTTELVFKGESRGGFTSKQKARIAAGQALFLGAAGVPIMSIFGAAVVSGLSETMGLNPNDPDDVAKMEVLANGFNQGMAGLTLSTLTGADAEFASRAGLGIGVVSAVKDIITSKDPLWIKMLGLTGETGRRVGDAAIQMKGVGAGLGGWDALRALTPLTFADQSHVELTDENWLAAAKDVGFILGGIPSSTRNFLKARMMHHSDKLLDRRGRVRIEKDFAFQTEMAVALGFRTTDEARLQALLEDEKYYDDLVHEASNVIVNAYHRYVYKHNMDEAYAENLTRTVAAVQQSLDNPWLVEKLQASLESRLFNDPQTIEEKALNEFYDRTAPEMLSRGMVLDSQNLLNFGSIASPTPVLLPFSQVEDNTQEGEQ